MRKEQAEITTRAIAGDLDLVRAIPAQKDRLSPELRAMLMNGLLSSEEAKAINDFAALRKDLQKQQNQVLTLRRRMRGLHTQRCILSTAFAKRGEEVLEKNTTIAARDSAIATKNSELATRNSELAAKDAELATKDLTIAAKDARVAELQHTLANATQCLTAAGLMAVQENAAHLPTSSAARFTALRGIHWKSHGDSTTRLAGLVHRVFDQMGRSLAEHSAKLRVDSKWVRKEIAKFMHIDELEDAHLADAMRCVKNAYCRNNLSITIACEAIFKLHYPELDADNKYSSNCQLQQLYPFVRDFNRMLDDTQGQAHLLLVQEKDIVAMCGDAGIILQANAAHVAATRVPTQRRITDMFGQR